MARQLTAGRTALILVILLGLYTFFRPPEVVVVQGSTSRPAAPADSYVTQRQYQQDREADYMASQQQARDAERNRQAFP